jgi:hypothetical protein
MTAGQYASEHRHECIAQIVNASVEATGSGGDVNGGTPYICAKVLFTVEQATTILGRDISLPIMGHTGHNCDLVAHAHQVGGQVSDQWAGACEVRVKAHVEDKNLHISSALDLWNEDEPGNT